MPNVAFNKKLSYCKQDALSIIQHHIIDRNAISLANMIFEMLHLEIFILLKLLSTSVKVLGH